MCRWVCDMDLAAMFVWHIQVPNDIRIAQLVPVELYYIKKLASGYKAVNLRHIQMHCTTSYF
jgi:hypothetical protein